jgi:PleD family two-component response regulator
MINIESGITVNNISNKNSAIGRNRSNSVQNSKKRPSSYRILIVDDEKDIALVYKTVLEEAGFNVDVFMIH